MRITEVARRAGVTTDDIRYLEMKGYIQCQWITPKNRSIRDYVDSEVSKIELIIKYRREGFEHEMAYSKAMDEMQRPRLI